MILRDDGSVADQGKRIAQEFVVASKVAVYPHSCCHNNDFKPVPCKETRRGLLWRGVVVFNETQVKPSQDQFCHVCVKVQIDMISYVPLCVFVPPTS